MSKISLYQELKQRNLQLRQSQKKLKKKTRELAEKARQNEGMEKLQVLDAAYVKGVNSDYSCALSNAHDRAMAYSVLSRFYKLYLYT